MTRIAPANMLATAMPVQGHHARLRLQFLVPALMLALAGCSSVPKAPAPFAAATPSGGQARPTTASNSARVPTLPPAGSGRGGYYQDDGPGDRPPEGLLDLPDVIPKVEPYSLTGNKPYVVFGKTYSPMLDHRPFKQRGIGSWYGKKFHGQRTSSGEPYDMYKLTAAHPTLPIPSYARVTNLSNGAQVIVRINDRGPFHSSRIIDLSYTAALKLGYLGKGSSELEVERLLPEEIARIIANQSQAQVLAPVDSAPTVTAAITPERTPVVAVVPSTNRQSAQKAPIAIAPAIADPLIAAANSGGASATAVSFDRDGSVSGYYVQLGAFTEAGNAEAARARLMQAWDSSLPPPEVTFVGVFYRLHSGPFASRTDAALAAEKAQAMSEIKPLVVQR